jgi:hypothetical protein
LEEEMKKTVPSHLTRFILTASVLALLAGCAAPTAAPTATPTLPPPFPPPPQQRPPLQPPKQPNTPLPPPTPAASASGTQANLFRLIQSVPVTPDEEFLAGGFIRLGYVPAQNQIVAAFGSPKLAKPIGNCAQGGKGYKVYTPDMQPTGEAGVLQCEGGGDTANLFVDNFIYDVVMANLDGTEGWIIKKFDAVTMKLLKRIPYKMEVPHESSGDMSIEFINGVLDVSGSWTETGKPFPPGEIGGATTHNFFDLDLNFLGKRTLSDTGHIVGSSTIYVDGIYYFVSSNAYAGDVILMKYDKDWKFLGMQTLVKEGHWPEGIAYDGRRFYLAYLDTSLRNGGAFFPYYPNVHLAAFDRDWNRISDIAVTNYTEADKIMVGRPWILMRDNRLYVAYDACPRDSKGNDDLEKIEVYVGVYDVTAL